MSEPTTIREWKKYRIVRSEGKLVVQYNIPTGDRQGTRSGWMDHCKHDPLPGYVAGALKELQVTVEQLGVELFEAVQAAQGAGFVSDAVASGCNIEGFFARVRGIHLKSLEATGIIREFLKKHGEWK